MVSAGRSAMPSLPTVRVAAPAFAAGRPPVPAGPDGYELALIQDGGMWIAQARNETEVSAGDLVLWNPSLPLDCRGLGAYCGAPSRAIVLHLPRTELPLPDSSVDRLLATSMPGRGGVGGLLARFLSSLVREAPALSEPDAVRLGRVTRELAAVLLAHHAGLHERLPDRSRASRHRELRARIESYIDARLGDPGLTPSSIAARHHISVRTLHWLFRDQERTVAAAIRDARLRRCRADLADGTLAGVPIHAIAARWGFTGPAAFSRAFRSAYGATAGEFRDAAAAAAAGAVGAVGAA